MCTGMNTSLKSTLTSTGLICITGMVMKVKKYLLRPTISSMSIETDYRDIRKEKTRVSCPGFVDSGR